MASLALLLVSQVADAQGEPLLLSVSAVRVEHDPNGHPILVARFVDAQAFGRFTQENVGRRVEFRFGTRVIFRPFIREPILGGVADLSVATEAQARELADLLSGGNVQLQVDVAAER